MGIYSPLPSGTFASPKKSSERLILFGLLQWYDCVAGCILAIMMVIVIWPIMKSQHKNDFRLLLVGWPLLVVGYVMFRVLSRKILTLFQIAREMAQFHATFRQHLHVVIKSINRTRRRLKWNQIPISFRFGYQAIFLIVFLVAFMAVVRQAYKYAGMPIDPGSLWLLYILPIQHVARAGSIMLVAFVCVATAIVIFIVSRVLGILLFFDAEPVLILKAFWLLLICLIPTFLTIYLADREASVRKIRQLIDKLAAIHLSLDHGLASAIADTVAHELGFSYVNIFVVKTSPDGSRIVGLRIIGSANEAGRKLVNEGFVLDGPQGIVGTAVLRRHYCLVNNVRRDLRTRRRFIDHASCPGTRSELALPIMFGDTILGVLDIQSTHSYAFNQDDVILLQALTTHLAIVFSDAQNLLRIKGLHAVSQTATQQVVTHHEASLALREIIESARNVLQADSVVLYTRDPLAGVFGGPYVMGIDSADASPARIVQTNRRSIVHALLRSTDIQFLSYDATYKFSGQTREGPVFVNEQGIRSSLGIPIPGPDSRPESQIGVIFANYRMPRPRGTFTQGDIDWCRSLADITSLVLRNASLFQQVKHEERINLGREIHDGLGQYASFTRMLLEQTVADFTTAGELTPVGFEKLCLACEGSQRLQEEVVRLLSLWRGPAEDDGLFSWANAYTTFVNRIPLVCQLTVSGDDSVLPPEMKHDAQMMIREAFHNSSSHGKANVIRVGIRSHGKNFFLRIIDDGIGFKSDAIQEHGGIANMKHRAGKWGGYVHIPSLERGTQGTCLLIWLPLTSNSALASNIRV